MYKPINCWKARERKKTKKYVLVKVPEHPRSFKGGWVYEHRLVIERELGRVLHPWETCHHINERKDDNVWQNLFLCTRQEHDRAHRQKVYA